MKDQVAEQFVVLNLIASSALNDSFDATVHVNAKPFIL